MFYQFLFFQTEVNERRLSYVYHCVSLMNQVFVICFLQNYVDSCSYVSQESFQTLETLETNYQLSRLHHLLCSWQQFRGVFLFDLSKITEKIFTWFDNNQIKVIHGKCHLLSSTTVETNIQEPLIKAQNIQSQIECILIAD